MYDGNVPFIDEKHTALFAVALVGMIGFIVPMIGFGVPYTLLLLLSTYSQCAHTLNLCVG